ncbi:MAG: DUF2142 domain-containing protein [Planctomycetaceae bacterium]
MTASLALSSDTRSERGWTVVVVLAMAYFAVRAGFYAINIAPYVPPDEKAHFGISEVFAKTWLLPNDSPESYRYGLITHVPSLYYYVMGRVANLNVFFDSDLPFLRLANALLGTFTVLFAYLWMRRFTTNRLACGLFAVVITNIPMFTFLCGSVNYDNLTNLLAAVSVYYLTRFFEAYRAEHMAAFLIAVLLGSLTKVTFLPLAGMLGLVLLLQEWRTLGSLPAQLAHKFRRSIGRGMLLSTAVLLLLGTNVYLYGGNLVRFGRLVPVVQQVLTQDQCMQNPVFARDYITKAFREGRIGVAEAMALTDQIDDLSIKQATIAMLNEALRLRKNNDQQDRLPPNDDPVPRDNPEQPGGQGQFNVQSFAAPPQQSLADAPRFDPKQYTANPRRVADSQDRGPQPASRARYLVFWIAQLGATTFGILGQLSIFMPTWQLGFYAAIFGLAFLVFVTTRLVPAWRRHPDFGRAVNLYFVAGVVLAYTAVLFEHNYASYLRTGMAVLAVQGRYLFPVMVPMYGLLVCYLLCYWPRRVQWLVAVATAAWFVAGDLPFFLAEATPQWFAASVAP